MTLRISPTLELPAEADTEAFGILAMRAWAAGIFEGEGCISHDEQKRGKRRMLSVVSTDMDVLERFRNVVGAGRIVAMHVRGNRKPAWRWECGRWRDVERIVRMFLPYLCARRRARALALLADPPGRQGDACPSGHPLRGPDADVYHPKRGGVACAVCVRERMRRGRRAS